MTKLIKPTKAISMENLRIEFENLENELKNTI